MKKDCNKSSENLKRFVAKHGGRMSDGDKQKIMSIDDNSMDEDNQETKQGAKLFIANQ